MGSIAPPGLPLRTVVLRGLGWLTAAQSARQVLQLCLRVLLVRLLLPSEFGLAGMVTAVSGFLLMFHDLGFGPALVRKESVTEAELSTVFWLNGATGLLLSLLTAGLGPLLAQFYRQPAVAAICVGLSCASLAAPLGTVPHALLQRRLAFRSLAVVDLAAVMAGGLLGVSLAFTGFGVWSLVWQINGTSLATVAGTLIAARWAPGWQFDAAAARRLWGFGGRLTAASALNYWARNLDNLLIGRFLGTVALGYYSQAYQMMLFPVQSVAALAGRVMAPALARVQADRGRCERAYLQALRGIAALTFPLMLGAMVLAPDLYAVLFGARWQPSVFLFQVLCAVGMLQSIGTTIGWVYMATGRSDLQLRWNLIVTAIVLPVFALGLHWGGLRGVTIGYAAAAALLFAPSLVWPFRLIQLPPMRAARRLAPLLAAAAGMALCVSLSRGLLTTHTGAATRLAVCLVVGTAVYPYLLQALRQRPFVHLRSLWTAFGGR